MPIRVVDPHEHRVRRGVAGPAAIGHQDRAILESQLDAVVGDAQPLGEPERGPQPGARRGHVGVGELRITGTGGIERFRIMPIHLQGSDQTR